MSTGRIISGLVVVAVTLTMATGAIAKTWHPGGIAGEAPNYQYTNIAPLPGGGVAIDAKGNLDGNGAMQVNIPVAFTPGWGYASFNAFKGEHPVKGDPAFENGSSVFGLGFFKSRRVFMSGMQVSRVWHEAKALSGQVMLCDETAKAPAISVGMQDILKKEPNGRSSYIVLTKSLQAIGHPLYATLGYGGGRFLRTAFGGVSMPVAGSLNAMAEWDGFQLNSGLGWRPGGRKGNLTVLAAYNGHAGILLGGNVAFAFAK